MNFGDSGRSNMIGCCQCGTRIEPNPTNMCVACLRSEVDVSEGIPKTAQLYFCRKCERYLVPPGTWTAAALGSAELLNICVRRLKGLNKDKVKLNDAKFLWTEPHSMRVKVLLTVSKEVMEDAVMQQDFVVEYTVVSQMCSDCHRIEAKDYWKAVVQVRQKAEHKRTLYYVEQLIMKNRASINATSIKPSNNGMDFFFGQQNDARRFVDLLLGLVPCKYSTSKQLVSHDPHNNTYNYKYTYCVDIVPICRDSIVCMPKAVANSCGEISRICLCFRVGQTLHFIDPNTLQITEMTGQQFWRQPFEAVCSNRQLTEYMVMDVEINHNYRPPSRINASKKHVLADVMLARSSDLGVRDDQVHCRTHLGHLLNPGDLVLGFDFKNCNINNRDFETVKPDSVPDVLLVKKVYDKTKMRQKRQWKLKRLVAEWEEGSEQRRTSTTTTDDWDEFQAELTLNPDMRENINIYRDSSRQAVAGEDSDDGDAPVIPLTEMMEDFHISDDATGGEGAPMME